MEKYEIIEEIGRGLMSICYKGFNKEDNKKVVIKMIKKENIFDKEKERCLECFNQITRILSSIDCPNIVKLYEYFNLEDVYILILEYCDTNLQSYIDKSVLTLKELKLFMASLTKIDYNKYFKEEDEIKNNDIINIVNKEFENFIFYEKNRMTIDNIRDLFYYINRGLKELNLRRIPHLNINLSNILLQFDENKNMIPKLADFSITNKEYQNNNINFCAPEILKGSIFPSIKSDLWSIGIILYKLFFNEFPFKNYKDLIKKNSLTLKTTGEPKFDDLLKNLLQIDQDKRIGFLRYIKHPFFTKVYKKYPDGMYEGEIVNGKRNGFGVFQYSESKKNKDINDNSYSNRLIAIGYWKDDKLNGYAKVVWLNGNVFKGYFIDDKKNGWGIQEYNCGDKYEGEYVDDLKNGFGIYYWHTGERHDGYWENDYAEGNGIRFYINGDFFCGNYHTSHKHGYGIYYFYRFDYFEKGDYYYNNPNGIHSRFTIDSFSTKEINYNFEEY